LRNKMQALNDGVVRIYSVTDAADPGNMPVPQLVLEETLRYKERTVGINRYYAAKQAGVQIKHLLRVPRLTHISTQDIAILNDGTQYKITLIQYPEDELMIMDMTLEDTETVYPIAKEEEAAGNES
jgi:hypothetical protein